LGSQQDKKLRSRRRAGSQPTRSSIPGASRRIRTPNHERRGTRDERRSSPTSAAKALIGKDERVACVLTGHTLKDPNVTVNYHKDRQGPFSNPPNEAPNDLQAIIDLIR
jgi:hypothetical protein